MISEEEKLSRQRAVQFAIDNNRLEGLEPSDSFLIIADDWVNGKITTEEYGTKIYEIHGIRSPHL